MQLIFFSLLRQSSGIKVITKNVSLFLPLLEIMQNSPERKFWWSETLNQLFVLLKMTWHWIKSQCYLDIRSLKKWFNLNSRLEYFLKALQKIWHIITERKWNLKWHFAHNLQHKEMRRNAPHYCKYLNKRK